MAVITRDQLSSLSFGYITGLNLLQYCPDQLLIKAYADSPYLFSVGVNQAYADLKSRLATLYDVNQVFSNANQVFRDQSASFTISIPATVYVSQIFFQQNQQDFPIVSVRGLIDINSYVSVGITLGGTDIINNLQVGVSGLLVFINKYFAAIGSLYITITGPAIDVEMRANKTDTSSPTASQQMVNALIKDDLLTEIVSKLAIKKILGSAAGVNKQLKEIFDENENVIEQIQAKQRLLNLPAAPAPIMSVPYTVESAFKTIG